MPCAHIGLEQQFVVVGLHLAQLGNPLGRLPIGYARIVEAGGHQHGRIILRLHLVVGRVAEDIGESGLVGDGIAPFLPFARRQREAFVQHGVEHVDEGHVGHDGAVLLRILVDDRAHQLAACGPAAGGNLALGGVALLDQAAADIDEVVESVGALEHLALQVPAPAEVVAAADMRDGIGEAAVDQAEARGRKAGRHGIAIGAIGIKVERHGAVLAILAIDHADRDHRAVARLHAQAFGGVERGVVAARDFLLLEQFEPACGDVVVIDRIRRDHAFIVEAQLGDGIFGIVRQARIVARFGEADGACLERRVVGAQLDLVEPVEAAFGHEEILEQVEAGQVEFVRSGDHGFPFAGRLDRSLGEAEVDVIVIGPHEQVRACFVGADIDRIFDTLLARPDEDLFAGRIVCAHEAHFAGLVVARGDDQPVVLRGQAGAHAEALVFLFIERDVAFDRRAEHVQLRFERAPFLGRGAVDQRGIVRDPGEPAAQVRQFVRQQFAGLQVLDPRGVAFRPVAVGRIGEIAPVLAHRRCTEPEVFQALCQFVLVEDQHRIAARYRLAVMLAVLRALFEFGPVEPVAILLRNGGIVFLDPGLHLFEQGVDEFLLRRHARFVPGVFRLHVVEDVLVIDRRIALVLEPVIRIGDRDPVMGIGMVALLGLGRRGRCSH